MLLSLTIPYLEGEGNNAKATPNNCWPVNFDVAN